MMDVILFDTDPQIIFSHCGPTSRIGCSTAIQFLRLRQVLIIFTHRCPTSRIGVDTDWAVSEPTYADIILSSVMKNLDGTVVRAVKAIEEGTFAGGIHLGTLETGEVGLAPFHELDSLISDEVKADLEQIKADIIAGKIKTKP